MSFKNCFRCLFLLFVVALLLNCAAGNERYSEATPAGFWSGLWHGFICFFTFIISLFSDSVRIYEGFNNGGWYDFGFILGAAAFFSGSHQSKHCPPLKKRKTKAEAEWEEIGHKVEAKIRKAVKDFLDENEDEDWEEIGRKIEEKIKQELRNWAEK